MSRHTTIWNRLQEATDVPLPRLNVNGRLTSTAARVVWRNGFRYPPRVEVSRWLLEVATDEELTDTLIHEAAHIIANVTLQANDGHGTLWWLTCKELGGSGQMFYSRELDARREIHYARKKVAR